MKNQLPVLIDPEFCKREQHVVCNGELLKIIATKQRVTVDGFEFDCFEYLLYSNNTLLCNKNTFISKCQILVVDGNPGYNKRLIDLGVKEVPLNYIWLKSIYSQETRKKGYASMVLNIAISDVLALSNYLGQNLPILFNAIKTSSTNVLYRKFNADENVKLLRYPTYSPMIVKKPQVYYKHAPKVIKTEYFAQSQPETQE